MLNTGLRVRLRADMPVIIVVVRFTFEVHDDVGLLRLVDQHDRVGCVIEECPPEAVILGG